MNRRVASLGAVFGALVMIIAACTSPPGPSTVDRIDSWTVDGDRIHTLVVLEPNVSPPAGFVENTSTSSTVELTDRVALRLATPSVSVSCVDPQSPVGTGLSCPAGGPHVTVLHGTANSPAETYAGVLSGTLTTTGPAGSITAVFDGTLSGLPYGIADAHHLFSVYDGAPSGP